MHIKKCRRRGHVYYAIVHSMLREDKVIQDYLLNLGRLDTLTEPKRLELEQKISALGGSPLLQKFHTLLYSIGYSFPSPVSLFSVEKVYEYGRELALHKLCEEIDFINIINHHGYKA
jgi:hypothetical protein